MRIGTLVTPATLLVPLLAVGVAGTAWGQWSSDPSEDGDAGATWNACLNNCWEYWDNCENRADRRYNRRVRAAKTTRDADIEVAKAEKRACFRRIIPPKIGWHPPDPTIEEQQKACNDQYDEATEEVVNTYREKVSRAEVELEANIEVCILDAAKCIAMCPAKPAPIEPESMAFDIAPDLQALRRRNPEAHRVLADGTFETYTLEEQWHFVLTSLMKSRALPMPQGMDADKLLLMLVMYDSRIDAEVNSLDTESR